MLSETRKEEFIKFIDNWENIDLDKFSPAELDVKNVRKILNSTQYFNRKDYLNNELSSTQLALSLLNDFVSATMGWIHCNPSKKDTVALAKEAYVFPNADDLNACNTRLGMEHLFEYLIEKKYDGNFVVIKGNKGAGKTYTQNYFLNTRTSDLFDEGITWFRIDLTKVLSYQKLYTTRLALHDYLYAQIVYVYFRYGSKEDKILKKINVEDFLQLSKVAYDKEYSDGEFSEELIKVKEKCLAPYFNNDGLNKPFKFKIVPFLAQAIIKLLQKNEDRFLLFIDGLDNVDYIYDDNLNRWIHEIYNGDIVKILFPSKLILTCRPETNFYIEQIFKKEKFTKGESVSAKEFIIEKISEQKIIANFSKSIEDKTFENYPQLQKQLEKIEGLDKKLIENIDRGTLKGFYEFGEEFSNFIAIATQQRHESLSEKLTKDNVLEILYNNSLRDMLYDIKHAYMYIDYSLWQKAKRERRKKESVMGFLALKPTKRSYLVIASLSRHGRIYYNSTNIFTPPFMLLHTFNLFNFINLREHLETKYRDMFLPILILQYVEKKACFFDEILMYCNQHGFESKDIIRKIERKLLENGLLEIEVVGVEKSDYTRLPRRITLRGEYALTSMEDMDILHSFSYEMYFPQPFISRGIVKAHKNDLSDYSSAQISNVLSILKLLQLCQEKSKISALNHIEFFTQKIKNQLIGFATAMSDKEIENIMKVFKSFIAEYSTTYRVCNKTREVLIAELSSGQISLDVFTRTMRECGYS